MANPSKWVVIRKLSDLTGYTEDAIRSKIKNGVFRESIHYRHAPDNRILFNVEAIWKWIEGELE